MKKQLLGITLLGAGAALPLAAQADAMNYIDGYYVPSADVDFGLADDDGDGYGVKGRAQFADQLFFSGEYQQNEYDDSDLEFTQLRAGVGFMAPINADASWLARAEFINAELEAPGAGSDDESGFGVHVGAEAALTPRFIVDGSIGYLSIDDTDGPEFRFGGRFLVGPQFSIFADYRLTQLEDGDAETDFDDIRVGVGFMF